MAPGVYRAVLIGLVLAGAAAAGLAALAAALAMAGERAGTGWLVALAGLAGLALIALWVAGFRLRDHVERLERLRGDMLAAAAHDQPLPARWQGRAADEVGRLARTMAQAVERQRLRRGDPDARLAAVVAAAAGGLVVVTETGLVSLVNAAALSRFGADRLGLGTSIYDLFHRSELAAATARARAAGQAVTAQLTTVDGTAIELRVADLGEAGGVVISLPPTAEHAIGVRHDLRLHEQPPPVRPIGVETPLAELPVVVLDTETTGLDVATDRIVSIGAVRLHGRRIFRHLTLDRLVNPGQPIPARSTAIHGISTAMVAGTPGIATVLPAVTEFLSGCVVVGHCMAAFIFNLGILAFTINALGS